MTRCNRCGKCCHYMLNGELKRCKYLVNLKNGTTICRVYGSRLGKVIDENKKTKQKIICIERQNSYVDYEDCPFNRGRFAWNTFCPNECILFRQLVCMKTLDDRLQYLFSTSSNSQAEIPSKSPANLRCMFSSFL